MKEEMEGLEVEGKGRLKGVQKGSMETIPVTVRKAHVPSLTITTENFFASSL